MDGASLRAPGRGYPRLSALTCRTTLSTRRLLEAVSETALAAKPMAALRGVPGREAQTGAA